MNFLKNKKLSSAVIIGVILLISIVTLAIWQSSIQKRNIIGKEDDHGCLAASGYYWCEAEQKCLNAWEESCISSGFPNDQMEKAISRYLLAQDNFSWRVGDDSQNFCVVENLDSEKELFPIYVWAYCGEYVIQDGQLKTLSGSSGPIKIDYPNELSFYDSGRFSYEAPGDGSRYSEDIKRIFPENVQQKIFNFESDSLIRRTEAIATSNILSWESIKQAIGNCEAKSGFQNHSKDVTLKLKNGSELIAVEPNIDDIMTAVDEATVKCGSIPIATE